MAEDAPASRAERDAALQALFAAVEARPHGHDFFALLRRVEVLAAEAPRFGLALRPSQEPLRLAQEPELDFAPASLASMDRDGQRPRLAVRFFGLLGPQGPLPLHLTEQIRERLRLRGDAGPMRFLDVFHHRLLSLFYRAWAQGQPTVQRDRPRDDRYAAWLGSLAGLSKLGALPAQEPALLHAGMLASRSRHPEGLRKILSLHFGVPVQVVEHVPHWMMLAAEDRSRLGHARSRRSMAAAAQLGRSATAGGKVRDRVCKFRIVLGPLNLAQYESFLPGAPAWRRLCDWVRLYAGLDLLWDVQLCLARPAVPAPRLQRAGGVRLGLTAWPGHGRPSHRVTADPDDLRLRHTSFLLRRHGAA